MLYALCSMRYALCDFSLSGGSEGDRKPSSVSLPDGRDEDHFSRALIAQGLKRPHPPCLSPKNRGNLNGPSHPAEGGEQDLFGLAPGGVYQATSIARGTGGLLPRLFTLTRQGLRLEVRSLAFEVRRFPRNSSLKTRHSPQSGAGGVFSVALSLPREAGVAAASQSSPRYGPPCPMELGLSSPQISREPGSHGKRPSLPPPLLLSSWL
jgi:hypothetical protein